MISLVPFSAEDFRAYRQPAIQDYAAEKVKAGNWPEAQALALSEQEFQKLLPQGLETEDNFLYSIVDRDRKVGFVWIATNVPHQPADDVYIFDFEIYVEDRRKGYATAALRLIEGKTRDLGKTRVSLHVFGHNLAARKLYAKNGFEETNVAMSKRIA